MWRWSLACIAVVGLLACPHECAAKAWAGLSLQHGSEECGCCNPGKSDCEPTDSSVPAQEDCQGCICEGATVAAPTDFSIDLTSSIAHVVPEHLVLGGRQVGSTTYSQSTLGAISDESCVGRCTRLAMRSLLL